MRTKILGIVLLLIALPLPLAAQRNTAAVTGHVYDPAGRAVPGATVTARQTATGAVNITETNAVGLYQFPFLRPATYSFTFSKAGFKEYVQSGITLDVAANAVVDAHLQLGAVTQTVNVTANASMLQATSGENSWTISEQRVTAIPVRNDNTILATWFAPGVTVTSGARNLRGFDTSGTQHENLGGGLSEAGGWGGRPGEPNGSGNLVLVDGISANTHAVGVGFNAIADTVQQVHVQSTMYDAQYGWTTGGVINTITKGGTNTWHGHAYEKNQNTIFNTRTWQEARAGIPRGAWHQNYWGGSVGGPLLKNKLFAFFAYEEILQVQPDYNTGSVPTPAMKNGDFSDLYSGDPAQGGVLVKIYDPLTTCGFASNPACATDASGNPIYSRTQFSGNIITPSQMNPVAKAVMTYIPDPTSFTTADPVGLPGTHLLNWITNNNRRKFIDDFPAYDGRLDYNLSDKTHMFFRYGWNSLYESRSYSYSFVGKPYSMAETSGNSPFGRQNDNAVYQVTHTFNPTTVLQVRTGVERFRSISGSSISAGFDVGSLGFSPTFVSQASSWFPQFSWSDYIGAGSRPLGINPSDTTITTEAVLAKTMNKHNMKFGFQNMVVGQNQVNPGQSAGSFSFNGQYTTANPLAPSSTSGNSVADFLLGYPISGYIDNNSDPALRMHLWSVFAQDDIRVTPKLTLTAGIRWAYQGPLTDRFNAVARGFCYSCTNPIQVPGMTLLGGLEYAGVGSNPRGIQNPHYGNIAPRFGFAYRTWRDTVVRGGFGIIYAQAWQNIGAAPGFSQQTTMLTPDINGTYPEAGGLPVSLTNPFPFGVLTPVGAGNGLAANVGRGVSFVDPNTNIPQVMQYSLSVQHQFRQNWLASASYVGSYLRRLRVDRQLNYVPLPGINQGPGYLDASVTNPMYGAQFDPVNQPYYDVLAGTFMNKSTVAQKQLLLPYPEFSSVNETFIPIGKSKYNAMWVDLNKRMSHGLDFDINFTWSKTLQKADFLNATDSSLSQFLGPYNSPEQIKFSGVWDLPFGPGREFGAHANPVVSRLIEGWQVSGISRWQAGFPIPFPVISGGVVGPTGASVKTAHQSTDHWFNTCYLDASGNKVNCSIDTTPAWQVFSNPYTLMHWAPYLPNLRGPSDWQTDIGAQKSTTIKERYKLTFRAEASNATNTPDWAYNNVNNTITSGAFGRYTPSNQSNNPRVIMMSLELNF